MTPPSTPASAPTPMATIDSPRAMITIRPWRSAKWCGTSFQPSDPNRYGPSMSSASAAIQSASCASPSTWDAATSSPTPIAVLGTSPIHTE